MILEERFPDEDAVIKAYDLPDDSDFDIWETQQTFIALGEVCTKYHITPMGGIVRESHLWSRNGLILEDPLVRLDIVVNTPDILPA
jgi:hypothetical protein